MPMEVFPGSGRGGGEPSGLASGDGFYGEGEAAWLRRVMAEADDDEGWIPEERAEAALAGLEPAADLGGFAQDGPADLMAPGPELAALAAAACDPGMLAGLTDNQVLGLAGAGRRLAGRGAWIQQTAAAEFAARRAEPDRTKATPLGFTPFACGELAPELVITDNAAELQMAQARDAARRLPANVALLRDGRMSEFQLKIITESTQALSDADAAEADTLLAAAAPSLTPGKLRAMCTRVVMMIDPAAAQRHKDSAAKDARVVRFQEHSGNAALCGRDLPPDEVLASSAHVDACARALRAAGIPGTLQQLRVRAYLDLTQGLDPLARTTPAPDTSGGAPGTGDTPGGEHGDDSDGDGPGGPGGGSGLRPGGPSRPSGSGAALARPPVKAVINLLVPAGTLYGWPAAPGEIAGFGLLDPQATRDMVQTASAHPETRWCVTVIGPDGTAAAHGCAPGPHPWTPGSRERPGPPRDGPPGTARQSTTEQAAQVAGLLRRLRVQLAPIARGHCDHRHHSDKYVIGRTLKHLIQARAAKCTAPGCNRPAAEADADHTIPWPLGPSCECNLGPQCKR
jgi:Domain of unknown function (DUF222)